VGKVLSYQEDHTQDSDCRKWYQMGGENGCISSQLELWKLKHKKQVSSPELIKLVLMHLATIHVR